MIRISKDGQWDEAISALSTAPARMRVAMDRAVLAEAQMFRSKVIQGITNQAPGGKKFKKLSETTLAIRRFTGFNGTKALMVRGDLRNSVKVTKKNGLLGVEAFVGVHRTERGKDGKSLINIAEVHEFGAGPYAIAVTPAMRKFLMAAFSKEMPGDGEGAGDGSGGLSTGIIIVKIPPRPFMRPVIDKWFSGPKAAARFQARVMANLGGLFGGPGSNTANKALARAKAKSKRKRAKGKPLLSFRRKAKRDPSTGRFKKR